MQLDAIITNHPERVVKVLEEDHIRPNFRLATHDDNPFLKIESRELDGPVKIRKAESRLVGRLGNWADTVWRFTKKDILSIKSSPSHDVAIE